MAKPALLKFIIALVLIIGILPIFKTDAALSDGTGYAIDHNCPDITQSPQFWIEKAKADLHIGCGHTSHGGQLTSVNARDITKIKRIIIP